MGKAKELAELGDKLTVTGSAVTVSGFNYDNIVDSAPGALDTLNELAAALGDDANFSTTVTNSIATKLPLAGGTLTGDLTITSGTSGDATLTLIADTDNNNEFDNPKILFIQDGGYEAGGIRMSNNDTVIWNGIAGAGGPGNGEGGITFRTGSISGQDNATIKMYIKPNGNVGIGTTSPSFPLSVQADGNAEAILVLGRSSDDIGEIAFRENDNSTKLGELQYRQDHLNLRHRVGYMAFATGGVTERMRLDSSGTLLVGRNADGDGTAGAMMRGSGFIQSTRDGNLAADFNRLSSFGDILRFQKDSSPVGTIGSPYGGELYIGGTGANSSGLLFTSGNSIQPRKNNASDNGNIDIGTSGNKFKDLHLANRVKLGASGGIEFGHSTSSASGVSASSTLLDHYEEGYWEPVLSWYTPSNGSVSYIARTGFYIRVGRIVTVHCEMRLNIVSQNSASLPLLVSGFPYPFRNTGGYGGSLMQVSLQGFSFNSGHIPFGWGEYNSDRMFLFTMASNAANTNLPTPPNYKTINVSGTYITPS